MTERRQAVDVIKIGLRKAVNRTNWRRRLFTAAKNTRIRPPSLTGTKPITQTSFPELYLFLTSAVGFYQRLVVTWALRKRRRSIHVT